MHRRKVSFARLVMALSAITMLQVVGVQSASALTIDWSNEFPANWTFYLGAARGPEGGIAHGLFIVDPNARSCVGGVLLGFDTLAENVVFIAPGGNDRITLLASEYSGPSSPCKEFVWMGPVKHGNFTLDVHGGGGNDWIHARGMGANRIFGDAGDDEIFGGLFPNVDGGEGNDTIWDGYSFVFQATTYTGTLNGGPGNDKFCTPPGGSSGFHLIDGQGGSDCSEVPVVQWTLFQRGNHQGVESFTCNGGCVWATPPLI